MSEEENNQPTTSNITEENNQPTTSNITEENNQPTTSNITEENNQPTTSNVKEESEPTHCQCRGARFFFVLSGFLGMCIVYMLRVNMSIAVVAMVNKTAALEKRSENNSGCPLPDRLEFLNETGIIRNEGYFTWSPAVQGVILGSFYYGYSAFQIPGGRLADIYNSKWVFGIGTGLSAVLSLLIPVVTHYHIAFLIVLRTMQGLAQGVTMPAMYSLMGKWAPDSEKTVIEAVIMSGINIGTVVGIPLTAQLCNSYLFGGWPSAFYIFGLIGCLWFFLWIITVKETPQGCSCITPAEVEFITSNQAIDRSELPPIPWLEILTFGPYWAVTFAQVVGDWTFYLILNDLPIFYSTILHFNIEQNGLLSSFPFLLQSIVGCLAGFASDAIIRKKIATPTATRKICSTIGCVGSTVGLAIASMSGCNVIPQILSFTFTMAVGGFFYCSYMVAMLDISPEYAGTLIGIANTLSNLTGFLTPMLVGALTDGHQNLARWRIIFFFTKILLMASAALYLLFSTAEKQDWQADHHQKRRQRCLDFIANCAHCRKREDSGGTEKRVSESINLP